MSRDGFVRSVLARELLVDVAQMFAEAQIPLMPLKGILLAQILYPNPTDRDLYDVDVLVPRSCYRAARALLERKGFRHRVASRSRVEESYIAPSGMDLDLHRAMFGPRRFALRTADVFEKGRPDLEMFGVPLVLPDALDLYAHTIGKIATDHIDLRNRRAFEELGALPKALRLEPGPVAEHLCRVGLSRAALYALPFLAEGGDAFASRLITELPEDVRGRRLAEGARALVSIAPPRSVFAAPAAYLLDRTIPHGLAALSIAAVNRVRTIRR